MSLGLADMISSLASPANERERAHNQQVSVLSIVVILCYCCSCLINDTRIWTGMHQSHTVTVVQRRRDITLFVGGRGQWQWKRRGWGEGRRQEIYMMSFASLSLLPLSLSPSLIHIFMASFMHATDNFTLWIEVHHHKFIISACTTPNNIPLFTMSKSSSLSTSSCP